VFSLAGEYASAIETLVTAISLIKQSKVANDDRCKILISSLQDTLHGVETKSYGSARRGKCSIFQINCVFFYLFMFVVLISDCSVSATCSCGDLHENIQYRVQLCSVLFSGVVFHEL
jgi:hypothetical protein